MRSEGSPDPTLLGDINTFLNVNRKSPEELDVKKMRDDVVLILSVRPVSVDGDDNDNDHVVVDDDDDDDDYDDDDDDDDKR